MINSLLDWYIEKTSAFKNTRFIDGLVVTIAVQILFVWPAMFILWYVLFILHSFAT